MLAAVVAFGAPQARASDSAERGGIGMLSVDDIAALAGPRAVVAVPRAPTGGKNATTSAATTATTTAAVSVDPRRSLIVTEQAILASFPILPVLNALAAGSPNSMIARQLYDQWMDLANVAPGIGTGGHCNDQLTGGVPTMNGFQFDCARVEGRLVGTNPTNGTNDSLQPIALVNRFDLASDPRQGGTDCGEYRMIYAKRSGMTTPTDRFLIIFEGVLPNPKPNGVDLSGCKPVAQFWAGLTGDSSATSRAAKLKSFYFTGLPGFLPVVRAAAYGMATAHAKGQIRINMFMQQHWVLREYHLALINNFLKMQPSTDRLNPAGLLFDETNTNAKGGDFRSTFPSVVQALAINNINTFNMNALPSRFDAGDADEQSATKSAFAANLAKSPKFSASVQSKLIAIGSTLTPTQIVDRADAMSCAGCHQLSNGKNLGGGLVWPSSLQFVHVSEAKKETSSDGLVRFAISPALTSVFLPHRKQVLESFVNAP